MTPTLAIPDLTVVIPDLTVVIPDLTVVIPDLIQDPVPSAPWIAEQVRNDSLSGHRERSVTCQAVEP